MSLSCTVWVVRARLYVSHINIAITDSEERILHWVRRIVQEAWAVVDFDEDDDTDIIPAVDASASILAVAVLQIWAHFFKSNTQWRFINMIGESLEKFRKLLIDKMT